MSENKKIELEKFSCEEAPKRVNRVSIVRELNSETSFQKSVNDELKSIEQDPTARIIDIKFQHAVDVEGHETNVALIHYKHNQ